MLLKEIPTYKAIRREYQNHRGISEAPLVDHYAYLFSPLATRLFIRFGISPNTVTVAMILCGLLGAAMFALPLLPWKCCGIAFIHLWFVLDCSDGEVARITRHFSRFGKQLDSIAHIICHPAFGISFAISLVSLQPSRTTFILFVSLLSISTEMILRDVLLLRDVVFGGGDSHVAGAATPVLVRSMVRTAVRWISTYPTFALVFPVVYLIDCYTGHNWSLWYMCAQAGTAALTAARSAYVYTRLLARE
jgi:phosphatidylserine synthase